jgi:hypothetical protein
MSVIARRPMNHGALVALGLAVAALSACGSKDDAKPAPEAAKTQQAAPPPPVAPPPVAQPPQPVQPAAAGAPPGAAAPAPAPAGGRSAVPTTDEWNGVAEVTVLGSSALNCETRMVREWVRVSCRGDEPTRGKPTSVKVERGGGAETFTFASGGVASLVFPFEVGTDVQALFKWEKQSHRLVSQWPRGAPKPTAYGKFNPA